MRFLAGLVLFSTAVFASDSASIAGVPCTGPQIGIPPGTETIFAEGGSNTFGARDNCAEWNVTVDAPWLHVQRLQYDYVYEWQAEPNPSDSDRVATLRVESRNGVAVAQYTQKGLCRIDLDVSDPMPPSTDATLWRPITAVSPSGCQPNAYTVADWPRVTFANGGVVVWLPPHFGTRSRQAEIRIGDRTLSVTQQSSGRAYEERLLQLVWYGLLGRLPEAGEIAQFAPSLANPDSRALAVARLLRSDRARVARAVVGAYAVAGQVVTLQEFEFWRDLIVDGRLTVLHLVREILNRSDVCRTADCLYSSLLARWPTAAEVEEVRLVGPEIVVARLLMSDDFIGFARGAAESSLMRIVLSRQVGGLLSGLDVYFYRMALMPGYKEDFENPEYLGYVAQVLALPEHQALVE